MLDDHIDLTIKTTIRADASLEDTVAVVGDLVHNALTAGYDIGPRGITVKASRQGVTAHLVPTEDEKV